MLGETQQSELVDPTTFTTAKLERMNREKRLLDMLWELLNQTNPTASLTEVDVNVVLQVLKLVYNPYLEHGTKSTSKLVSDLQHLLTDICEV